MNAANLETGGCDDEAEVGAGLGAGAAIKSALASCLVGINAHGAKGIGAEAGVSTVASEPSSSAFLDRKAASLDPRAKPAAGAGAGAGAEAEAEEAAA